MKVNVSDYLEVVRSVYTDACTKCSADVFDLRDLETIRSRVENEGMSFLTISLPQFSKFFERSLADGKIDSTSFPGFKSVKGGSIPAFLQGMISQIFNRKTGEIIIYGPPTSDSIDVRGLADDIPTVVESVRQVCRLFAKVELPCSEKRIADAYRSFTEIEQELSEFSASEDSISEFRIVSSLVWGNAFRDFSLDQLIPKHGPGATADRISGNQKYVWRRWHERLEPYFPLIGFGYPSGLPELSEELEFVSFVPEDDEQPVRVITVPKTLKTPRIIAIEPAAMQYAQQAIRTYLYDKLESFWLTSRSISFRDQSKNQAMALKSSRTGRYATIDLSEASDRVPLDLAMIMFEQCPDLHDAVLACRSTRAYLPGENLIDPLRKFASMGSALCFPVEAMFFYTCCVIALLKDSNLSFSQRNVFKVSQGLRVYGDDIIVPSTHAEAVLAYLHKNNCKVNSAKTFVTGKFRESCGTDAYDGYSVTPIYFRRVLPENRRQHSELISLVATRNQFYLKGYWLTASLLQAIAEKHLGVLPYVRETSAALGLYSHLGYESIGRWNSKYQRHEVMSWVPKAVHRSDELGGWPALSKCLLKLDQRYADSVTCNYCSESNVTQGSQVTTIDLTVSRSEDLDDGEIHRYGTLVPEGDSFGRPLPELMSLFSAKASLEGVLAQDEEHLIRSALHGAVTLKRRWVPPH
ncbi:RNA-directed RNA polymerase [ssRNA phage Gerhypos.1_8]|uniref:RNA-directed RNA polymerase n=2 Tax=Leviviricetes TaxID=2842243 RepID=A0A8S5KXH6_9VIRU|nr:RNA-directed RNA polymerase [ssRNA phage Gerhypos.1_8]QDH90466.1 MAG: RNA-dependent RNA polymerase [Leviviridae sp.]DAD50041.1 TPA_asm: RNA-directed RNA polymerase [ssRNA phage Gerhypos.1_8]